MGSDLAGVILNRDNQATFIIAGNEPCDEDVVPFLGSLLQFVIGSRGPKGKQQAMTQIVAHVMDRHKDKVFECYHRILKDFAHICLPKMGGQSSELEDDEAHALAFQSWFKSTFFKEGIPLARTDMLWLATECCRASDDKMFDVLHNYVSQDESDVESFEGLYRLLMELIEPIKMSHILFDRASTILEGLGDKPVVESIPPSKHFPIPLLKKKLGLDGIANRMFSNSARAEEFHDKLRQVAPQHNLHLQLEHYQKTIHTRVHPEILILDYLDTLGGNHFYDNRDKYIACSKASCYLCSQYAQEHPTRPVLGSTSKVIDLQWRLPDISQLQEFAGGRFSKQKLILRKMTEGVREEVENFVIDRHSHQETKSSARDDICQLSTFFDDISDNHQDQQLSYPELSESLPSSPVSPVFSETKEQPAFVTAHVEDKDLKCEDFEGSYDGDSDVGGVSL
ncbi:hypothetical protein ASPWEDRAFT_173175 [Aspergillus wentii DTO 134E9]|uniref:Uncharacterized protein n=1 Tax=Aspergillus wentii DTO 134E9 TaxID=1073089 RepID=A0A1L9RFM7_ASPWE|nr:uncharacterized protein ASPWEDRAFT_173175 [Aspergillus wentii DTO 134E9]OJJ33739.1 hypothetical protein ASPWEDRAFT_173175 [Aspergillus wentii DTO 134E9]